MIKKYVIALSALVLAGSILSCNQPKADMKPEAIVLLRSPDPAPKWVTDENYKVMRKNGVKQIFFIIETIRPTLEKAKQEADINKNAYVANMIQQFTSTEMVKALEGMLNETEDADVYFSQISASISRNVNTGGIMPAGEYYEKLSEAKGTTNIISYRYNLRVSLDYDTLQQRILNATQLEEAKIKAKLKDPEMDINGKLKKQLEQIGE